MFKKILAISSILLVSFFITSVVSANSSNMIEDGKDKMNNMMNDAQNMVTDATDGIKDVTDNLENDANKTMDDFNNNKDNMNSDTDNENTPVMPDNGYGLDSYSASRTTSSDTTNSSFSIMWIVLAIALVVIVAAIWFYATQTNVDNNRR